MRATTRVGRAKPAKGRSGQRKSMEALSAADRRAHFGPLFFMQHLRGLVRDRCPEPEGAIPSVQMHLTDGETLDVCHIIGIAPEWVALAVHEHEAVERPSRMRTELVPYAMIARISIEATHHEGTHPIGFNAGSEPEMYGSVHAMAAMTPEDALRALAGVAVPAETPAPPRRRRAEPPTGSARRSR
jgi:hypothetical protein